MPHSLTLIIFPNDQCRKQEKALLLLLLHWISSAWNQSHSHKIEIRLSHSLHGNTLVAFPHPQKKIPSSSQDTHIWPLAHSHNPPQFSHFSSSSLLWSISWSFCYSLTVCAHALSKACRLAHLSTRALFNRISNLVIPHNSQFSSDCPLLPELISDPWPSTH